MYMLESPEPPKFRFEFFRDSGHLALAVLSCQPLKQGLDSIHLKIISKIQIMVESPLNLLIEAESSPQHADGNVEEARLHAALRQSPLLLDDVLLHLDRLAHDLLVRDAD